MKLWITAPLGERLRLGNAMGLPPDSSLARGMDDIWIHFLAAIFLALVTVIPQIARCAGRVRSLLAPEKAICTADPNLPQPLRLIAKSNPSNCKLEMAVCIR